MNSISQPVSMQSASVTSNQNRPFLTWQRIIDWAQEHYRCRSFNKDERIPARPGLLYLVQRGSVRLVGNAQLSAVHPATDSTATPRHLNEAFLGFVGAGQPFELVAQSPFSINAYAHADDTSVLWMYWNDLDNWPHFRREVLDAFRYQHQRKLLWLSTLGQRRTIDRLLGFITLLIEEYGEYYQDDTDGFKGYRLPWSLTHSQIGSAIGSTRVTVTRLMGKLRQQGLIYTQEDNLICVPSEIDQELRVQVEDGFESDLDLDSDVE